MAGPCIQRKYGLIINSLFSFIFLFLECVFPRTTHAGEFSHLVIRHFGQERVVPGGGTLSVVRGDVIHLVKAVGVDDTKGERAKFNVNVKGFEPQPNLKTTQGVEGASGYNTGHDLDYPIKTGADLDPRWSEGQKGEIYPIEVRERGRLVGTVQLQVVAPLLEWAEVRLDTSPGGSPKRIRPGETLQVTRKNSFRLQDLKSNIVNARERVQYRFVAYKKGQARPDLEPQEGGESLAIDVGAADKNIFAKMRIRADEQVYLEFIYAGQIFARLNVQVEG